MLFRKKIEGIYRARMFVRHDDTGRVKYFSPEEFPGLVAEAYHFTTKQGDTLAGWFYTYPDTERERASRGGRLVVFAHGLGGGHRSYMKEIERLAREGYRVYAYDNTGCMKSEGDATRGLAASLSDLDDCLTALKADDAVDTTDLSVVGHSWGGYAAMNILAYHRDVKRVVAFAGFVSVAQMVKQSFPGPLALYRKHIMSIERMTNPAYADASALDTLSATEAHVLLYHSRDDGTVSYKMHFAPLARALEGRENITCVTLTDRGHNPNYTADAVAYKQTLYAGLKKLPAVMTADECEAFRTAFDWDRMTAQDEDVWARIVKHLDQ